MGSARLMSTTWLNLLDVAQAHSVGMESQALELEEMVMDMLEDMLMDTLETMLKDTLETMVAPMLKTTVLTQMLTLANMATIIKNPNNCVDCWSLIILKGRE